jgi:hypothetical protein
MLHLVSLNPVYGRVSTPVEIQIKKPPKTGIFGGLIFEEPLGTLKQYLCTNKGDKTVTIWGRIPNNSIPQILTYDQFQAELLDPYLFANTGSFYRPPVVITSVLLPDYNVLLDVAEGVLYYRFETT